MLLNFFQKNDCLGRLSAVIAIVLSGSVHGQPSSANEAYRQSLDKRNSFSATMLWATRAIALAEEEGNSEIIKKAHIQLGVLCWSDGKFDEAIKYLNVGRQLSQHDHDIVSQAKSIHYLGLVHYYKCNFDSAIHYYQNAENLYAGISVDSAVAKIKSHKGLIYNVWGDYEKAIQNMVESFRIQEKMPGYRDLSLPMQFPGEADAILFYESKLQKDLESLRFLKGKNDLEKLAFTEFNVGKDYYYLKKYSLAIPHLLRSANYYKQMGQLPFTGDLAAAYAGAKMYDSAEFWYRSRLADVQREGTKIHLAAMYADVGLYYRTQQNWQEALELYEKALGLNRQIGLLRSESQNRRAMAEILLVLGNAERALAEIDRALAVATAIKCRKDIQEYLSVKANVCEVLGKPIEAVAALKRSKDIADSLANGESQMKIARLQLEYDSEKKSRDLEALQIQNDLKEAELANKNLLLLLGMVIISSVSGLVVLLYWRYRQKVKNEAVLEAKRKLIVEKNELLEKQTQQKEALLHEIHHRVKNNLQIISSLVSLKSRQASAESKEILTQLNGRIYSMGLLHEKLYQKESIQSIRLDSYLIELSHHLLDSLAANNSIKLKMDCDEVEVGVEPALTCGLICNELLTNSVKYASRDDGMLEIFIQLKRNGVSIYLNISDNGTSCTKIPDLTESFGLRFVDQLIKTKLAGVWTMGIESGFRASITIPV